MHKDDLAMNITELHEKLMKANDKQSQEIALKIESSNGQNTQRKKIESNFFKLKKEPTRWIKKNKSQ